MDRRKSAAFGAFAGLLAVSSLVGCVSVCADELESTGLGGSGPGRGCVPIPLPRSEAGDPNVGVRPVEANGCSASAATDKTAEPKITITFDDVTYDPRCVRVKLGTVVTVTGDFAKHHLWGGYDMGTGTANDADSPFPYKDSGMSFTVTMSRNGTFPYLCPEHFKQGMEGAVIVELR